MEDVAKDVAKEIEATTGIKLDSLVDLLLTYGLHLLGAIAIFLIGRFIARRLANLLKRGLIKAGLDRALISFFYSIAYFILLGFVLIAALGQLGVETTSFAAAIAAAGLAIGLALQGSLSNFAAGVLIIIFRPFKAGDYVEVAGVGGDVNEISIFTTTLKTLDNKTVIVPNSQVTNGNIINYSTEPVRRIDLVIGAGYDDDVKKVKAVLDKIIADEPRVLLIPEPVVALGELGENSINYVMRPWVKTPDFLATKWALLEAVKIEFDKAGFSIPFPQRDIHHFNAVTMPQSEPQSEPKKVAKKLVKKG
jgi:small conductance mechanosensitive channel